MNPRHKPRPRERRTPAEYRNRLRATVDAYGPEEAGYRIEDGGIHEQTERAGTRATPSTDQ